MIKKLRKNIFLLLIVVIISVILIYYTFTLARYVANTIWDYYLVSKGFYFSSDYLGTNVVKNVDNVWDGSSVHFNIKNSLNQAVVTTYDINYRVVCTIEGEASSYAECQLNGTSSNELEGVLSNFEACVNDTGDGVEVSSFNKTECELRGYKWEHQEAIQDLYFDIIVTDEEYELLDVVVRISVISTAPYRKTLAGTFSLHKGEVDGGKIAMEYKNYQNYDRLIITNSHSTNKCLKISWDASKLLIDANGDEFSDYSIDSNGYINEIRFNLNAKNSLSYIFYKRDFEQIFDVTEFSVDEDDGC